MSNNVQKFLPKKLRNEEFFKFLNLVMQDEQDKFENDLRDVTQKHYITSAVSEEVVREVFKENGLETIVDLFDSFEEINFETIAAFSGLILLLKGNIIGFRLVLDLLGFEYQLTEWWEQNPKGPANTILLNIDLDVSTVSSPYTTMQRVKKFTASYILPLIYPLTYTVSTQPIVLKAINYGMAVNIRYGEIELGAGPELLYANTAFVIEGEDQNYNVKFNSDGEVVLFPTEKEPTKILFVKDDESLCKITEVDGELVAVDADLDAGLETREDITLINILNTEFTIAVDNSNNILIAEI